MTEAAYNLTYRIQLEHQHNQCNIDYVRIQAFSLHSAIGQIIDDISYSMQRFLGQCRPMTEPTLRTWHLNSDNRPSGSGRTPLLDGVRDVLNEDRRVVCQTNHHTSASAGKERTIYLCPRKISGGAKRPPVNSGHRLAAAHGLHYASPGTAGSIRTGDIGAGQCFRTNDQTDFKHYGRIP